MRHPWRSLALLPAMRMLLLFALGVALQWQLPCSADVLLPIAGTLFVAAAVLALFERRWRGPTLPRDVVIALLLTAAGMLRCADVLESYPTGLLRFADIREKILLRGTIADDPRIAADRQRFLLDITQVVAGGETLRVEGRVLCRYGVNSWDARDTLVPLRAGHVIEARSRLRVPRPPRNPGAFDARRWVLGEGASLQASVSKGADLLVLRTGRTSWWKRIVSDVRNELRRAIGALYAPASAAVMNGLVLGDRSGIDEETLEDFRRSGIMHILAVSGLHAGIVLSLVFIPLERLRFSLRAGVALAVLWMYAAVTGFAPPVTRAALMATLFLGGTLVQRPGSSVNALAAAGVLILALDPLALFGLSFQLSFGAVLGILLFHDRIKQTLTSILPRRLRGAVSGAVLSLFSLTVAAQALTLPLLAGNFGQVSASGLLTNLVAVPLVFVVVTCGMLSLLLFPVWFTCADLFAATAGGALELIVVVSELLASLPLAVIDIPALPPGAWILYVSCIAYLSATPGHMRQKLVIIALLVVTAVICGSMALPSAPQRLRVTFFDVGQGDAVLIEIPGRHPWLIDTGPGDARMNSGSHVILPALRAAGIRRLEALVITHPDNDHAGGAPAVIEGVRVDSVYVSCAWPDKGDAAKVRTAVRARGTGMRDVRAGERLPVGTGARMYVLSPPDDIDCEPSNENSVVLLLVYGSTRFLFTGDAGAAAERRMIVRFGDFLRADVLKVGHHGSTTSTSPGFAVKVKPKHAVITVGRNNRFNHPRQEILTRLRLIGAEIHRTDIEGAIIFESDGSNITKLRWSR